MGSRVESSTDAAPLLTANAIRCDDVRAPYRHPDDAGPDGGAGDHGRSLRADACENE